MTPCLWRRLMKMEVELEGMVLENSLSYLGSSMKETRCTKDLVHLWEIELKRRLFLQS